MSKSVTIDVRLTNVSLIIDSGGELQGLNAGFEVYRTSDGKGLGRFQRQYKSADLAGLGLTAQDKAVVEAMMTLVRDDLEADL